MMGKDEKIDIKLVNQKLDIHIEQQRVDFIDVKNNISAVNNKTDKIMTNHLPHIQTKIDTLDKKLYGMGLVASVLAPIIYFLIQQFIKIK